MNTWRATLGVASVFLIWAPVVPGQVANQPDSESTTIVYDREFFARHNVASAEEMLRRIPGVATILDEAESGGGGNGEQRGFGSDGDQVLINGRRLAGKSNEISSALRRIRIQNLARVELIRGTSSELDVRSDGVVVNVVLKAGGAATQSGSAMLAAQFNEQGFLAFDGSVIYNGELGNLGYLFSIERRTIDHDDSRSGYANRTRAERFLYPTGEIFQIRPIDSERSIEEIDIVVNSTYEFARGDRLQLNALLRPSRVDSVDEITFTEFAIDGALVGEGVDLRTEEADDELEVEFGGTYERRVGSNASIKILGVFSREEEPTIDSRTLLVGGQTFPVNRNGEDVESTEAILRGSYYFTPAEEHSLEIGAEVAQNSLEQTIELSFDLDGDGVLDPIDLFDPSSEVTESRSEVFVNHNWTLNDRWTAASSLIGETSRITQRGEDINNSTSFEFLKPRVDVRFAPTPDDLYRFVVERTVSQLNFSNFVPRFNVRDDRFTAGNPDLRPETAWEYGLSYEHRFAGDQGVIETRVYYNEIQDRIETIAVDLDGDGDFDNASGNIGDAREVGAEIGFSIRLTRFGLPNLLVGGGLLVRDSSTTDPFTQRERKMATNADYEASLNFRHDLADLNLSYGAAFQQNGGRNIRSEFREFRFFERQPELDLFLEKRFGTEWILRFDARGLTENKRQRDRTIFSDGAIVGTIARREFYTETRDRRYTVGLTRTF